MTTVTIFGRPFNALIDTGSVTSYVNETVAQLSRDHHQPPTPSRTAAKLANGLTIELNGTLTLELQVCGQTITHPVSVLQGLSTDLLLGVDILGALKILQPLLGDDTPTEDSIAQITPTERTRLTAFLEEELAKFDTVSGPTPLVSHTIRLKERHR